MLFGDVTGNVFQSRECARAQASAYFYRIVHDRLVLYSDRTGPFVNFVAVARERDRIPSLSSSLSSFNISFITRR